MGSRVQGQRAIPSPPLTPDFVLPLSHASAERGNRRTPCFFAFSLREKESALAYAQRIRRGSKGEDRFGLAGSTRTDTPRSPLVT